MVNISNELAAPEGLHGTRLATGSLGLVWKGPDSLYGLNHIGMMGVVKIRHSLPCLAAVFGIAPVDNMPYQISVQSKEGAHSPLSEAFILSPSGVSGDIIIAYRSYAWPLPFIVIVQTYPYFDFLISFHKERLAAFHPRSVLYGKVRIAFTV